MATKTITMKVDSELLDKFDEFVKSIGANRSVALNMLMTSCVKNQKFPELSAQEKSGYDFGNEM